MSTAPSGSSRLKPGCRRLLKLFRRDRSGASAIEFGIVAAPFFALLLALIEVSLVFFGSFTLENAVDQAARMIRTGQAQQAGMTAEDFKTQVCSNVYALFDCATDVKVEVQTFEDFGGISLADPLENGALKDSYTYEPGNGGDVVIVRVFYAWKLIANFPGVGLGNMPDGSRLLIASTTFRNEPFDN
jgi:Flp pilus assembly protein TadG